MAAYQLIRDGGIPLRLGQMLGDSMVVGVEWSDSVQKCHLIYFGGKG